MKEIRLICDSGSSKARWTLSVNGQLLKEITTEGINPYVTGSEKMTAIISGLSESGMDEEKSKSVFFYGAGCTDEGPIERVRRAFSDSGLGFESLFIGTDLLAAGRSLFGMESGIACILGTGSSSAACSDGQITSAIPPLGYVLGDEGGGVDLGRRLLVAFLKKDLDVKLNDLFIAKYKTSKEIILHKIYYEPSPNRYLASFAPFVRENLEHHSMQKLAINAFSTFIEANVLKYENCKKVPVGFIGSVANAFEGILSEIMKKYGLQKGPIRQDPMSGLLQFHKIIS